MILRRIGRSAYFSISKRYEEPLAFEPQGLIILASALGWVPCSECGFTDGSVDCDHRTSDEMRNEAFDFLNARDGKSFKNSLDPGFWEEY